MASLSLFVDGCKVREPLPSTSMCWILGSCGPFQECMTDTAQHRLCCPVSTQELCPLYGSEGRAAGDSPLPQVSASGFELASFWGLPRSLSHLLRTSSGGGQIVCTTQGCISPPAAPHLTMERGPGVSLSSRLTVTVLTVGSQRLGLGP